MDERRKRGGWLPLALAAAFACVVGWSAWRPYEARVWWMEMVWALGVFAALAATCRRFRFSDTAYALVFVWLVLHTIGAHYTFERVPCDWLKSLLGATRNHYDRLAHFAVGLNAFLVAELAWRRRWVAGRAVAAVFGVLAITALAGAWEVVEWLTAAWDGGADGLAFLGSQGDVWDAQKDILADILGALAAALLFLRQTAARPA